MTILTDKDGFSTLIYQAGIITKEFTRKEFAFFGNEAPQEGDKKDLIDSVAATHYKLKYGFRKPMNKVTSNPLLKEPLAIALMRFGQSSVVKVAVDQVLAKTIGQFPSDVAGAAIGAFDFALNSIFDGLNNLQNIVGMIISAAQWLQTVGAELLALGHTAEEIFDMLEDATLTLPYYETVANNAASIMGINKTDTMLDLKDAETMIAVMDAVSIAFQGQTYVDSKTSLFDKDSFVKGIIYAAAVMKDHDPTKTVVYNPQLLISKTYSIPNNVISTINSIKVIKE